MHELCDCDHCTAVEPRPGYDCLQCGASLANWNYQSPSLGELYCSSACALAQEGLERPSADRMAPSTPHKAHGPGTMIGVALWAVTLLVSIFVRFRIIRFRYFNFEGMQHEDDGL